MSQTVAIPRAACVRVVHWLFVVALAASGTACDPRVFDEVGNSASVTPDGSTDAAPSDASPPLARDASLDAQTQRDGALPPRRDGEAEKPPVEVPPTTDGGRPAADAQAPMPDAAVERDLCNQALPAVPSLSGVIDSTVSILPALAQHPATTPRGPATTARFGARVMWIFGASYIPNQGFATLARNSFSLSNFDRPYELDEASAGAPALTDFVPDVPEDIVAGAPPLTYNMGSLIPTGPAEALLFYTPSRVSVVNNQAVDTPLGTRVARITTDLQDVMATPEPALLFPAGSPSFRSGLLARDNYVYLYGCPQSEDLFYNCQVARAPLLQATQARSYQYRTVGGWSNDRSAAIDVLTNARNEISVSWNPYLRRYLAVYFVWITNQIALQTAERPEGPFTPFGSVTVPMHNAPEAYFLSAAFEHPELAGKCGKKLVLTYLAPLVRPGETNATFELRPIELELR